MMLRKRELKENEYESDSDTESDSVGIYGAASLTEGDDEGYWCTNAFCRNRVQLSVRC